MVNVTKQHALRAANRPTHRITTVWGRKVRVYWYHDLIAGALLAVLIVASMAAWMAVL